MLQTRKQFIVGNVRNRSIIRFCKSLRDFRITYVIVRGAELLKKSSDEFSLLRAGQMSRFGADFFHVHAFKIM